MKRSVQRPYTELLWDLAFVMRGEKPFILVEITGTEMRWLVILRRIVVVK
jgi:hypothetical protein